MRELTRINSGACWSYEAYYLGRSSNIYIYGRGVRVNCYNWKFVSIHSAIKHTTIYEYNVRYTSSKFTRRVLIFYLWIVMYSFSVGNIHCSGTTENINEWCSNSWKVVREKYTSLLQSLPTWLGLCFGFFHRCHLQNDYSFTRFNHTGLIRYVLYNLLQQKKNAQLYECEVL